MRLLDAISGVLASLAFCSRGSDIKLFPILAGNLRLIQIITLPFLAEATLWTRSGTATESRLHFCLVRSARDM
jgi:hypothetical protein